MTFSLFELIVCILIALICGALMGYMLTSRRQLYDNFYRNLLHQMMDLNKKLMDEKGDWR
ncbi:MAG: hypothetical protein ACXABY_21240 [Candidatus Thorarchaeota archaeon]|jgi:hypothetical protein